MSEFRDIEKHLSPPEIAKGLHVDPSTVLDWIKSGELIARKLGRGQNRPRYRVALSSLETFLRSRETAGQKPTPQKRRKVEATDFVAMMNLD